MKKKLLLLVLTVCSASLTSSAQEANYDESKVKPYTLEDPLRFVDGRKVKNMRDWKLRRQEILDIFQHEMYGQMPPRSDIFLEPLEQGTTLAGFGLRRQVRMWFRADKTGPHIDWLIVTPSHERGPVPTILLLNYQGNQSVMTDEEILDVTSLDTPTNLFPNGTPRGKFANANEDNWFPTSMMLARGYALVTACYCDISPDPTRPDTQEKYAYTRCFALWPERNPARDDNTTSLNAWAWGLMRAMDMIEQDPMLDASRVLLTGYSRLGKAALIAGAFDERFPVVVPVQTGGGGVPLAKRDFGENISIEVKAFTHWYCPAYRKYAGHEDQMPFDQHLLLACIAPRALLVEGFDQPWFDTKGEFLALQAASPVWEKFCKKGLPRVEWPDDFDTSAIGPRLGYVRRNQEHGISSYDWTWMMDFADGVFSTNAK